MGLSCQWTDVRPLACLLLVACTSESSVEIDRHDSGRPDVSGDAKLDTSNKLSKRVDTNSPDSSVPTIKREEVKSTARVPTDVELAYGRLIATLPPQRQEFDAFLSSNLGPIVAESEHDYEFNGVLHKFRALQTMFISDDLEEIARREVKKIIEKNRGGVKFVEIKATDNKLAVLQILSDRTYYTSAWWDDLETSSTLFVRHPDSTILRLDFYPPESNGQIRSTKQVARMVGESLRAGPAAIIRKNGVHSFRFGEKKSIKLRLPDGFVVKNIEYHDGSGFSLERPRRPDEMRRSWIEIWEYSSDGSPLAEARPDYTERRALRTLGRPALFLEKHHEGRMKLFTMFNTDIGELYIEASAPDGAEADEIVAILESSDVRNLKITGQNIEAMRGRCKIVALDPNPPLNVRADSSGRAAVVGQLEDGTELESSGHRRGWLRITSPIKGWVWHENTRRVCGSSE